MPEDDPITEHYHRQLRELQAKIERSAAAQREKEMAAVLQSVGGTAASASAPSPALRSRRASAPSSTSWPSTTAPRSARRIMEQPPPKTEEWKPLDTQGYRDSQLAYRWPTCPCPNCGWPWHYPYHPPLPYHPYQPFWQVMPAPYTPTDTTTGSPMPQPAKVFC